MFLAFIFGLAAFATPVFAGKNSSGNLSTHAVEINTDVTEDMILNKQDIISVDYNNLPSNLKSMAKQGETPFDYATQKCLDGVSISPSTDEYGQTNVTAFLVSSVFSITEAESLYLWVYIPDTIALVLTIEVKSADGETLSWTLTPNDFGDILSTSVVGWKLLELPASAATKTLNDKVLSSITFTTFSLRYYKDETIEIKTSNDTLSFYHVFKGTSAKGETAVVKNLTYTYYKFSENFYSSVKNLYVYDTFIYTSPTDFFEYLVIGKKDLKNYSNSSVTFKVSLSVPQSPAHDFVGAEVFVLNKNGTYTLSVSASEYKMSNSVQIFSTSYSFNVAVPKLGNFSSEDIFIRVGETRSFSFEFSYNIELDSEVSVVCSDKSVAVATYYVTHNTCIIEILGAKKGIIKLSVSADAHRIGTTQTQKFNENITVYVNDKEDESNAKKIILWSTLALYLLAGVIYVIIKLVKSRGSKVR